MKKSIITSIFFLQLICISLFAQKNQNDPIFITIDNQKITKSEFLRIYNKNNSQNNLDKKGITDYFDMFINYKLKVIEAEHLGYDTVSSFIKEFTNYRDQLALSYLHDAAFEENFMREAYNMMLYEVHVRQIFIRLDVNAIPEDTLAAYNKAISFREMLKNGTPWDTVALKYADDNKYKRKSGDMGFITAFQAYYPIESAAYNLKVYEYSMPVRTPIGYHIVQVLERRPSRGEIKVAHIMAAFPENSKSSTVDSTRNQITNIYRKLLNGEKFEDLARTYSDDKRSAKNGGELNWFGVGQMIPEFENAAFSLKKDGEYTRPLKSSFGWHIIKRIAVRPISNYDDLKDYIKQRIQRDERKRIIDEAFITKIKKEINFKDNPEKLNTLLPLLDSTVFKRQWNASKAEPVGNNVLFTLGDKPYTIKNLADYIASSNPYRNPIPLKSFLNAMYKNFVNISVIKFEKDRLEQKYPEFGFLVQEYHDGILLFNLMEDKIWNQAAKDTVGLEKYYNDHKDIYKYGERINALVVTSPDKSLTDKAYTMAADYYSGKIKAQDILDSICKNDSVKTCINVTENLFEKGDNSILDSIGWNSGITPVVFRENKYGFFVKKDLRAPEQKSFQEAKGVCIADYQIYLEQNYLAELRKKYTITINNKIKEQIIAEVKK